MSDCKHYVGILTYDYMYDSTYSQATLDDLCEHIIHENNREIRKVKEENERLLPEYRRKPNIITFSDYIPDFTKYEYCPECGQKIDWDGIKKEELTWLKLNGRMF